MKSDGSSIRKDTTPDSVQAQHGLPRAVSTDAVERFIAVGGYHHWGEGCLVGGVV